MPQLICRRVGTTDSVMDAVLLHVLNHCTKAADAIKRGNEALKGGAKGADIPRDQGFSRCKVRSPLKCAAEFCGERADAVCRSFSVAICCMTHAVPHGDAAHGDETQPDSAPGNTMKIQC